MSLEKDCYQPAQPGAGAKARRAGKAAGRIAFAMRPDPAGKTKILHRYLY